MLGIEQAGIAETIEFILNHYSADLQSALVQVLNAMPVGWYLKKVCGLWHGATNVPCVHGSVVPDAAHP